MSRKPETLYWIDLKLSRNLTWSKKSAGMRGGKRSSLAACLSTRRMVLSRDPDAKIKIYEAAVDWKEITDE